MGCSKMILKELCNDMLLICYNHAGVVHYITKENIHH